MSIPLFEMQATGEFHVPGFREPVTGGDVLFALRRLPPHLRGPLRRYLDRGGEGEPPPPAALVALKLEVEASLKMDERATP